MNITDEIFQVGGSGLTSPEDAAVYLICFDGHAALVDAGCGASSDRLMDHIQACGVDPNQVEYLLITHCHFDHTGGAEAVRERTGARIVAHELDAVFLETGDDGVTAALWYGTRMKPFSVDQKWSGDEEIILLGGREIKGVHTPGHSPGSAVYLTESQGRKVLFAQDVHGPLHPSLLSKEEDYRQSLDLLLSLDADILCEGHYGVYRGKKAVRNFIRSFMQE